MEAKAVVSIADLLQSYGGWGLSSLLMVAMIWLSRYTLKLHEAMRTTLLDIIEKKVQAETLHAVTLDALKETITSLANRPPRG